MKPNNLLFHFQKTLFGIIEWDANFKLIDWNSPAEKIFGYTKSEIIGKKGIDFIVAENTKADVQKTFNDLYLRKESNTSIITNITKDGKEIICEWFNTTGTDEKGNIRRIVSIVRDITKIKQKKTYEQLELQEKEQTHKLKNLDKQLKSSKNPYTL